MSNPNNRPWNSSISRPLCLSSKAASCIATPIRSRTFSGVSITSKPATFATPEVGRRRVQSIRTVVDFPAPFGPKNPYISPLRTAMSTPPTAILLPKDRPKPSVSIAKFDITVAPYPGGSAILNVPQRPKTRAHAGRPERSARTHGRAQERSDQRDFFQQSEDRQGGRHQ